MNRVYKEDVDLLHLQRVHHRESALQIRSRLALPCQEPQAGGFAGESGVAVAAAVTESGEHAGSPNTKCWNP